MFIKRRLREDLKRETRSVALEFRKETSGRFLQMLPVAVECDSVLYLMTFFVVLVR